MVHNCTELNFAKYAVVNDNMSIEFNVSFSTSLILLKYVLKLLLLKV